MNGLLRSIAAAALSLASSRVLADEAEVVYYDIAGTTARELRRELNVKGPIGEEGTSVDGHTHWHVAWNFQYSRSTDGCRFTEFRVNVTGTITLPRWAAGESRADSLAKKWRSYLAALRLHEDGHYAHGVSAAEEVRALGQSFRIPGDCSTISGQFNDKAAAVLEKYRAADVAYDSNTRHGRTQGAVFP